MDNTETVQISTEMLSSKCQQSTVILTDVNEKLVEPFHFNTHLPVLFNQHQYRPTVGSRTFTVS